MQIIVAPTIVRFSHQMDIGGRACDCVSDVSLDEFAVSRETAVGQLVPIVAGAWQDSFLPQLGGNLVYKGTKWLDIDSVNGQGGFQGPIAGKPTGGQLAGNDTAPNTAYLVHKNCTHNRLQRAGRWYVPGVLENDLDNQGNLTGASQTKLVNCANQYKNTIRDSGLPIGYTAACRVVHIASWDADHNPLTWSSSDIDSFTCDIKVATQRRRLRG